VWRTLVGWWACGRVGRWAGAHLVGIIGGVGWWVVGGLAALGEPSSAITLSFLSAPACVSPVTRAHLPATCYGKKIPATLPANWNETKNTPAGTHLYD